jgi:hypothetical protein
MGSGRDNRLFGRRKRWALALVLLLVAVVVGTVATPRLWVRGSQKAPPHLELLYAALNKFSAERYGQATAILDGMAFGGVENNGAFAVCGHAQETAADGQSWARSGSGKPLFFTAFTDPDEFLQVNNILIP